MKTKIAVTLLALLLVLFVVLFCQIFNLTEVEVVFDGASEQVKQAVAETSGIELGSSIFSLSKSEVKSNIEGSLSQVAVDKVEKVFPGRVRLYVRARKAIVAVNAQFPDGSSGVVPTDRDFQLGKVYDAEDIDYLKIIKVTGATVSASFDVNEFVYLRRVIYAFLRAGFTEDGLVSYVSEFQFAEDGVRAMLRNDSGSYILVPKSKVDFDGIIASVADSYRSFLNTPEEQRNGQVFGA